MGRGLSDLQKLILTMANHQRKSPERRKEHAMAQQNGGRFGADLKTVDIIDRIGASRTNTARAAISRAFRRLEQRGLACRVCGRYWAGIDLTENGVELADQLGVDWLAYMRNISDSRSRRSLKRRLSVNKTAPGPEC